MVYTLIEKQEILQLYIENNYNAYITVRAYKGLHPLARICRKTVVNIYQMFLLNSSLKRKKRRARDNEEQELKM